MVFADVYLNYRYKLGRQEGHEEGRAEGISWERARWERYIDELEEARMTGKPEPERPAPHQSR